MRIRIMLYTLVFLQMILIVMVMKPGVFTIKPSEQIPNGETILYYGKSDDVPLFSSPERFCLQSERSTKQACESWDTAILPEVIKRGLISLPYIDLAYHLSANR